jgi:anti-anti-sigma regulatory factor
MARAKSRSESRRISLGGDVRIARAGEVAQLLADAREAGSVEIDAAEVERVDGAGLQAIAAGLARLRAARVKFRWSGVSPTLASSAAIAGLEKALQLK